MEQGTRPERATSPPAQPESFGMFVLRLGMWAAPVLIFAASAVFGVIAASDSDWGLLAVMVVMGLTAVALFVFHWWVLHRFGRRQ
jgi:hypothetical protein